MKKNSKKNFEYVKKVHLFVNLLSETKHFVHDNPLPIGQDDSWETVHLDVGVKVETDRNFVHLSKPHLSHSSSIIQHRAGVDFEVIEVDNFSHNGNLMNKELF